MLKFIFIYRPFKVQKKIIPSYIEFKIAIKCLGKSLIRKSLVIK